MPKDTDRLTNINGIQAIQPIGNDRGPCCLTYSGSYFYLTDPQLDEIILIDSVHATARQCRYGGVLKHHYSPAQHMVLCSEVARDLGMSLEIQFEALMHDIQEGILIDLPRPIKMLLSEYNTLEDTITKVFAQKYEYQYPMSAEVKEIDNRMLHTEAAALGVHFNMAWGNEQEGPYPTSLIKVIPATAEYARETWIERFVELWNKLGRDPITINTVLEGRI